MPEDLPEPHAEGFDGLPWKNKAPGGKALAYGGVVISRDGYFLLREVKNHFDGYVWTFAKHLEMAVSLKDEVSTADNR